MKKVLLFLTVIILILVGCSDSGVNTDEKSDKTEKTEEEVKEVKEEKEEILPEAIQTYMLLGENEEMPYEISDKSIEFMKKHLDFFPGNEKNKGAMSDFVNDDASYPKLDKSITKYQGELAFVEGYVVDIQEFDDGKLTYLHIAEEYSGGNYVMYYLGSLDEIYAGDYVQAYLLPFDKVTFENMNNAYTKAIIGVATLVGFFVS